MTSCSRPTMPLTKRSTSYRSRNSGVYFDTSPNFPSKNVGDVFVHAAVPRHCLLVPPKAWTYCGCDSIL
jgi:hypothetical protein